MSALTLFMPVLALRLGANPPLRALIPALFFHEFAHIAAAKLMQVYISEIRIMPFGGRAQMENPYGLSAVQLVAVAIAGPAANLICAIGYAFLAQCRFIGYNSAAMHVRINLVLFVFNMLPALPLDGGRILYALFMRPLGVMRAARIGIICGRALSLVLTSSAVAGFFLNRKLNLLPLMTAIFILASSQDELDALYLARAKQFINPVYAQSQQAHPD